MGFIEVLIIVIFGLLLVVLLYLLGIYNQLVFHKKKIEEKYQTISEEIINISNMTDKIIEEVKDTYEKDKIENVKSLNRNLRQEENESEKVNQIVEIIKFINFINTQNKENKKIEEYQQEITKSLDNIKYASEFYNNCVNDYNQYKEKKIVSIISKVFKFKDYSKCNITNDAN